MRQAELGGEEHLVAPSAHGERIADDLLALAVDVSGVDQGDAGVDRAVEHDRRFLRRGVAIPKFIAPNTNGAIATPVVPRGRTVTVRPVPGRARAR